MAEPLSALGEPSARRVVTAVEFDVLWERLGLGATPVALRLPSPGRSLDERREVVAAGWQALRERGLAGPEGPDPELARLMRLLARPAGQLELRATWGHSVRVVAAGSPGSGALAVRQDATVTLGACGSLPAALLGVLPPAPPGPGRSATVPTEVLAAALNPSGVGLRRALLAQEGIHPGDAELVGRMLATMVGRAQIVALAADRWGVARRCGGVVSVLDGARGRYLMTRAVGHDAVEWTTITPADRRMLHHQVAALLDGATFAVAPA